MQLIVGHWRFTLIEHLDVATKGYGRHDKLCAVAVNARPDRLAEAYRKAQHSYATATRHPVVAELVESNQHAQHHDNGQYVLDQAQVSLLEILPSTVQATHGLSGVTARRQQEWFPNRRLPPPAAPQ